MTITSTTSNTASIGSRSRICCFRLTFAMEPETNRPRIRAYAQVMAPDSATEHNVNGIRHSDNAGGQRNTFTGNTVRIAVAAPALMVVPYDLHDFRGKVHFAKNFPPDNRMAAGICPLPVIQRSRLTQHCVIDPQISNVVEMSRNVGGGGRYFTGTTGSKGGRP